MSQLDAGAAAPDRVVEDIAETGIAYLLETDGFFTPQEWDRIADIVESPALPYEHVLIGDAGELNNVRVQRFLTDVERPVRVNEPLASQLLDIINSPAKTGFYRQLLGADDVTLRRAQVNTMQQGNYIGFHLDTDSNPDYGYSVVLQLGRSYSGGEFVAYRDGAPPFEVRPAHRSVLISRSDIPHEVRPVQEGQRISLVYFVSASGGDNPRVRSSRADSLADAR